MPPVFGNILLRQRSDFGNRKRESTRTVRMIVADQNAFYGDHNAAGPDDLYQRYEGTTTFKLKG